MVVEKVYAYITQEDKLLVFKHTRYPEAGIQVPGGTVEGDESPEDAVLREVREETGLNDLEIISYLGMEPFDLTKFGEKGIQHRHFFHLSYTGPIREGWQHYERTPSDGHPRPIEFGFYWVTMLEEKPELAGQQGVMLHKVKI
jgi:ADP-ribose pyrophosphatase YjhB (NUDIX family)